VTGDVAPSEAEAERVRGAVRDRYAAIAQTGSCCGGSGACGCGADCCSTASPDSGTAPGGYPSEQLRDAPQAANLGLGCGNPTALLQLRAGEVVLDLGSGGGLDVFLAAQRVGDRGRAIGVDMTPEMVARARVTAREAGRTNVEFRLGELEHLPAADRSVDVVLSNCVINLVPDKAPVYREAFRVLRPGGRVALSDMIATGPIPEEARRDPELWGGCSSGALTMEQTKSLLYAAGFAEVQVIVRSSTPEGSTAASSVPVAPADILAVRPIS
jgi:arsenite methyltransferase